MVSPTKTWMSRGGRSPWVAAVHAVLALLLGAVPVSADETTSSDPDRGRADVSVQREGEESVVRLAELGFPVESVTTSGNEYVAVVEIVGVEGSDDEVSVARQVAAYDGVVNLVTVSSFESGGKPATRVEIIMDHAGSTQVDASGDSVEIRVLPIPSIAAVLEELNAPGGGEAVAPTEETLAVLPPSATELTGVQARSTADGVLIGLEANGSIGAVEAFTLENPTRLVVDLPGLVTGPEARGTRLDSTLVRRIRVGAHEGKVRVVLDGGVGSGDFSGRRITPGLTGLWISVGEGQELLEAMDHALEAEEAAWLAQSSAPGVSEGVASVTGAGGLESVLGAEMGATTDALQAPAAMEIGPIAEAEGLTAPEEDGPVPVLGSVEPAEIEVPVASPEREMPVASEKAPATTVESVGVEPEPGLHEPTAAVQPEEDIEDWSAQALASGVGPAAIEPAEVSVDPVVPVEASRSSASPVVASIPAKHEATDPGAGETVKTVEIYGLHYEREDGVDRTAILADDSVTYTTSAPDAVTWVVRLPHAHISEAASDRIFPNPGGPVSLIHAFQQPEVEVPEVRVVFTRAPGQVPKLERRGSMVFVEFEDNGVAAAPPPAFRDVDVPAQQASRATVRTDLKAASNEPANAQDFLSESIPNVDPVTGQASPHGLSAGPAAFEADPMMGALSAPESAWVGSPPPAAVEVPAAIEVLEEGGLIDGKAYRGRRVSLDFKDVEITDVLRLIAEVSDLNIIAGDEVSGDVTIRLVEVPWDQALDVILMTKGLGFVRVGNVLRIAPSDVLKAEEEVRLQERRNKEKLEDLEVKLLPVNYASVRDTEGLIKRLLSARGTVNLDERTNTLIIKDIRSVIDEATALIASIDTQTPQVMIEAKIVEANLDFSRELGSVWGVQTQQFVDPFDPQTPRQDLGSEDLTWIGDNSLAFANPISAVPTGLMTVGALILDQDFRVDAQIQAAESTGDGKVVSSPRIVTLDNKEAKIEQGVSIPFQTFEGGDAKLEFIDAVLSLVVTPHITADQSIIMEILVTRNAPDSTVPTPTGSPAIARNVAETETLVKDGQTLVLGGIYTINKAKTQSRIPYLHRIPVIGNAFKSNRVKDSRAELLVFVTPRIVRLPEMASN